MKLIFFGPPGCGKGTYASRIAPKLGVVHISTGDMFRAEVKNGTDLGKTAEGYVKTGGLVPDDIVLKMFGERIAKEDAKNGYILDGFPRTINQADELEKISKTDLVINISLDEDIIIEKALGRRVCKNCGNIYNIADINRNGLVMPPLKPDKDGVCDKCGSEIIQREDDNKETIKARQDLYWNQTEPLLKYYKEKGMVKEVQVTGPPDIMVPKIMDIVKENVKE